RRIPISDVQSGNRRVVLPRVELEYAVAWDTIATQGKPRRQTRRLHGTRDDHRIGYEQCAGCKRNRPRRSEERRVEFDRVGTRKPFGLSAPGGAQPGPVVVFVDYKKGVGAPDGAVPPPPSPPPAPPAPTLIKILNRPPRFSAGVFGGG